MSEEIMNYDPNMTNCGRMAKQSVRLTFAQWGYRATLETEVGGNCTGMDVIECAVGNAYDALPENSWGGPFIEMIAQDGSGDILTCEDDEDQGEDWLKGMLVAAEIFAISPDGNLRDLIKV